jgi:hypothetical protein
MDGRVWTELTGATPSGYDLGEDYEWNGTDPQQSGASQLRFQSGDYVTLTRNTAALDRPATWTGPF